MVIAEKMYPPKPPCWDDEATWRKWCDDTIALYGRGKIQTMTVEVALADYCRQCLPFYRDVMRMLGKCRG